MHVNVLLVDHSMLRVYFQLEICPSHFVMSRFLLRWVLNNSLNLVRMNNTSDRILIVYEPVDRDIPVEEEAVKSR